MHLSVFEACQIEIRYQQCLRIHKPLVTFPEIQERFIVVVPTKASHQPITSKWIV